MTAATEQPRARKAERAAMVSLGAVAGPLAGALAPQRVSTPPSSGLAAAPLGRAQRAASRIGSSSPAPAKVSPPPFYLLPRPFSLLSRSDDSSHRAAASEEGRAGSHGEPWRRRRPPRRRACSPTGEHAAVERPGRGASLVEHGEPAPPARLVLPCRRKGSSDAP